MFSFEHPEYFKWLLVIPIALVIWLLYLRWRRRASARLAAPSAQERVLPGWSLSRFWLKNLLLSGAVVLLIVAAANPRRGVRQTTTSQQSADVYIVLDVSQSMLARDALPSRLERAQIFARQLLRALAGERVGIVFFAGSAYVAMPLTTDYEAADMLLRAAGTELISTQGSDIGRALQLAAERFDPDPTAGRAIVLISDGEDHEGKALRAAEKLKDLGVIVFCVGVGTAEGAPIPLADGEYKRDAQGQAVRTRADEALQRQIAKVTRGEYYRIEAGDAALEAIRREIGQLDRRAVQGRSLEVFDSYYQWFAVPAFFLLVLYAALGWRVRPSAAAVVLLLAIAEAFGQSQREHLRQGDEHFAEGRYAQAEEAYRNAHIANPADPKALYNQGSALYRQGKYAEAQQVWEKALQKALSADQKADVWHNLGNALAEQGNLSEAIRAYENSLRWRPGDPDTKVNLQLARKKQQQSQPKPQEQPQSGNSNTSNDENTAAPPPPEQPQEPTHRHRLTPEEARRLLETTVAPQDQNSGRKYRELTPEKHQLRPKKDW